MGRVGVGRRTTPARALRAVLLAVIALGPLTFAPAVRAADVQWGEPTASATYGEGIEFSQPATIDSRIRRVEILLEVPGGIGPLVVEVEGAAGATTLRHSLLLADDHLLPNTSITARWRVIAEDGSDAVGPPVTVRYADTRFDWRTLEGDVVRVHWYEGSDDFGRRALEIGDRAVRETAELLGVTEDEPVDFFVYANQDEFYEALGPGTRENVGGQANAELRTLFALIEPGEIDDPWVEDVIPHELVHLVFDTAVDNPYHFPPRWLNEGIAVYLSQSYGVTDRATVEQAAAEGSLIPLEGLSGQFPTTRDRFFLAYSESVSAVDYLIRQHGRDALVQLVRSYATGLTDDEAFEQAIGIDVAAFDAAWRAELDAADPTEHGPQPAPAGPLPPGWTSADGSAAPTLAPPPAATRAPGATDAPGAPSPGVPAEGGPDGFAVIGLGLLLGLGVVAFVLLSRRRRAVERARPPRHPDQVPPPDQP